MPVKSDVLDLRGFDYYAQVPEQLIYDTKAPAFAVKVYAALDRHRNKTSGLCFPGFDTLTKRTGISRTHLAKCLEYLSAEKYIVVQKTSGKSNRYLLMPVCQPVAQVDRTSPPRLLDQSTTATRTKVSNQSIQPEHPAVAVPSSHPIANKFVVTTLLSAYAMAYRVRFNRPYPDGGVKDRKAAERLLKDFSVAQVVELAEYAWSFTSGSGSEGFYSRVASSLAGLASRAAEIAAMKSDGDKKQTTKLTTDVKPQDEKPKFRVHEKKMYRLQANGTYRADDGTVLQA